MPHHRCARPGVALALLAAVAAAGCALSPDAATPADAAAAPVPAPVAELTPRWRCERALGSAVLLAAPAVSDAPREDGLDPGLPARLLQPLLAASGCFSTLTVSAEGVAPARADFQLRAAWRLVPREDGAGSRIGGGSLGPAGAWSSARREAVQVDLALLDGRAARPLGAGTAPSTDTPEVALAAQAAQLDAAWGDQPPATGRERELGRALALAWQAVLPAAREQHAQWRQAAARAAIAPPPAAPAPVVPAAAPAAPAKPAARTPAKGAAATKPVAPRAVTPAAAPASAPAVKRP